VKKWVLSRRDSVDKIAKLESQLDVKLDLPKSAQAHCAEPAEGVVFIDLESLTFIQADGRFIPFLGSSGVLALFPSAVVDQGAIKFLLNGADVMRPGIKKLDDWGGVDKVVVVREDKMGRAIAVGVSTLTSAEVWAMTKGSCLKNLHHVGDRFWTLHKAV
jgi:PUA domain protein